MKKLLKPKLEEIKILTSQYGIPLIRATELVNQFDSIEAIVEFLKNEQNGKKAHIFKQKEKHFETYGHYLDYLAEEHKYKVCFMDADFCRKLWEEYFVEDVDEYYWDELYNLKPIGLEIVETGDAFYRLFTSNMKALIGWKEDDTVYYFNGPTNCIKSEWGIVCQYWGATIYEDNYGLIVNPKDKKFIMSMEYETFMGEKEQDSTLEKS